MMTLLRGGRIHPDATAMLVRDGVVAWVGDDPPDTADEVVELGGSLVTPAFVDAHVHTTHTGLALTGLDLAGTRSLAQALDLVEATARALRGRVVLGTGWDETRWPERRPPTMAELDRAAYGGVVYLSRVDGHSAVVSSALLAACPRARAEPGFDESGQVRLDSHHALRRAAFEAITPAQRELVQRAARAHAASLGIGCLHEMSGPDITGGVGDLEALLDLAAREPGPEVVGYWGVLGDVETVRRLGIAGAAGDLMCDGSIGSHTAALTGPYADRPDTSGYLRYDADQIAEHVALCTRAGVQAGFHAIGDRTLRAVLDGFAKAAEEVGVAALAERRHRIEHAEMPPSVAEFAALGLTASVQPAFDAFWGGREGMYAARLGAERAAGLNPFAEYAAAGVPLALSSDAPVTPMDPWGGVRAAVHHTRPEYGIAVADAFAAATVGGWRAARVDDAGTLTPRAPATYAVWDVPEFPDLAPGTPLPVCRRTVVRGVTVFERE